MTSAMIKTEPLSKKTFSEQSQAYIIELQDEISALDPSSQNFQQQLACLLSINMSLRELAINANFYIPKSPFAKILFHFEESINLLSNRRLNIDGITKGLFFEAIGMMSLIINEYCFEKESKPNWIELQNNLFDQITEHIILNTDQLEDYNDNSESDDKNNQPFNLDDTPEALHLFDIDFKIDSNEDLYDVTMDDLGDSSGFLLIQLDDETPAHAKDLATPELPINTDLGSSIKLPLVSQPEGKKIDGDFDNSENEKFDKILTQDIAENITEIDITTIEDSSSFDAWGDFVTTIFNPEINENEPSLLEELEKLEASFDFSNHSDMDEQSITNNFFGLLEEENLFWSALEANKDSQSDEFFVAQSADSYQSKLDDELNSELILLETINNQDFSSSDIDTAIEESPIYQNNNADSSWDAISLNAFAASTSLNSNSLAELDLESKTHNKQSNTSLARVEHEEPTMRISVDQLNLLRDLSGDLLLRKGSLDIYLSEMQMLSEMAYKDLQLLESNDINHSQIAIAKLQNTFEQFTNILERSEKQSYVVGQDIQYLRKNLHEVLKHPISSLVRKLPRILRDLSLEYGKKVELMVQGAEIGIEHILAGTVAESLELLLRNAFEHGIEASNERLQMGKVLQGKIEVIATQTDESTIVKVSDDGRGIDIGKIRSLVDRWAGLADASNFSAGSMNDEQLMGLIFEPNFNEPNSIANNTSTNSVFTKNSSRLSELRRKLREVGGTISVQSQVGTGTEFTIVLPNTLSLMRVLLLEINQVCLAIPSKVILEVIPIDSPDRQFNDEQENLLWRDRLIPIVRLNSLIKLNCRPNPNQTTSDSSSLVKPSWQIEKQKPANAVPSVLIIHHENDLFALQTDGCWNDQDVTFHQIEGDIQLASIFLGAAILGNEQAIALLSPAEIAIQCLRSRPNGAVLVSENSYPNMDDLNDLSNFFEGSDLTEDSTAFKPSTPAVAAQSLERKNIEDEHLLISNLVDIQAAKSHQPKILIVESSANVRRYLAMTLTKSGFLTEQAQDGKEAIAFLKERLNHNFDIDVVITDLEMPHMDGFKLLSNIRAEKHLQNLPVVVLTSRNNQNDQKLATDLGANAYFSKPYREEELVTTLRQIMTSF